MGPRPSASRRAREALAQATGDIAPAVVGIFPALLGVDSSQGSADHRLMGLADPAEQIAGEVHAAAPPARAEHFPGGRLQALMAVADHQLDATGAATGQRRRKTAQSASALLGITVMPSTSRRPSRFTAINAFLAVRRGSRNAGK